MENPYSWPEDVRREWMEVLRGVALNRYPDPDARRLRERLRTALDAGRHGAYSRQRVGRTHPDPHGGVEPNAAVLAPTPTFVMRNDRDFTGMKLRCAAPAGFFVRYAGHAQGHRNAQAGGDFSGVPEQWTGNLFSRGDVARDRSVAGTGVGRGLSRLAGHSFMDRLGKHDNLLVMRTLSKQGLAGLCLGILGGPARGWRIQQGAASVQYRESHAGERNLALTHLALLDEQARQIRQTGSGCLRSPGCGRPGPARPISFCSGSRTARRPGLRGLGTRGVLIKNLNSSGGMLKGCLRDRVLLRRMTHFKALEAAL